MTLDPGRSAASPKPGVRAASRPAASDSPDPGHDAADVDGGRSDRAELLGTLAAGIMHEFNNLLTVVLGSLEQLGRQPLDARGREQLGYAERAVSQAGRLARQTLSVVRAPADEFRRVDLNEVVDGFDRMIGQAVGYGTGVSLRLEPAPGPLPVRLDPGQLELALLNLVRNAADAITGSGTIVVRTGGHRIDGLGERPTVELAVSDTGAGMAPEALRRATDRFYTTKAPGRGTGLGLWMVRRFTEACGGRLSIESEPGRGTTVRLAFPRDDAE